MKTEVAYIVGTNGLLGWVKPTSTEANLQEAILGVIKMWQTNLETYKQTQQSENWAPLTSSTNTVAGWAVNTERQTADTSPSVSVHTLRPWPCLHFYNHSTVLCCTVLYSTVLYCTVLYHTVLYYTVLYCTIRNEKICREQTIRQRTNTQRIQKLRPL